MYHGGYNNTIISYSDINNKLVIWLRNCEPDNISWICLPSSKTDPGGNPVSWWHWLMRLQGVSREVLLQPSGAENIITLGNPYWQNSETKLKNQGRLYNGPFIRKQSDRLQSVNGPHEDNCRWTHTHGGFCYFLFNRPYPQSRILIAMSGNESVEHIYLVNKHNQLFGLQGFVPPSWTHPGSCKLHKGFPWALLVFIYGCTTVWWHGHVQSMAKELLPWRHLLSISLH